MHLSVTAIVLGDVLLTRSGRLLACWAVWFATANAFVLAYDEPTIRHRFGAAYERCTAQVGRWLPKLRPPRSRGP